MGQGRDTRVNVMLNVTNSPMSSTASSTASLQRLQRLQRLHPLCRAARPYESCKNIEGLALRDAPSKLVQLWYKTFPPDHDGQVEMKNPTRLSNKTSTA